MADARQLPPDAADAPGPGVAKQQTARFVFSIAPVHVQAILSGRKRWEFRRVRAHVRPGDGILVYATAPVGALVAQFTAGDVRCGPPGEIVALEVNPDQRRAAREYLRGSRVATAIQVTAPRSLAPLPIQATGLSRAPMSYQRLVR